MATYWIRRFTEPSRHASRRARALDSVCGVGVMGDPFLQDVVNKTHGGQVPALPAIAEAIAVTSALLGPDAVNGVAVNTCEAIAPVRLRPAEDELGEAIRQPTAAGHKRAVASCGGLPD